MLDGVVERRGQGIGSGRNKAAGIRRVQVWSKTKQLDNLRAYPIYSRYQQRYFILGNWEKVEFEDTSFYDI